MFVFKMLALAGRCMRSGCGGITVKVLGVVRSVQGGSMVACVTIDGGIMLSNAGVTVLGAWRGGRGCGSGHFESFGIREKTQKTGRRQRDRSGPNCLVLGP